MPMQLINNYNKPNGDSKTARCIMRHIFWSLGWWDDCNTFLIVCSNKCTNAIGMRLVQISDEKKVKEVARRASTLLVCCTALLSYGSVPCISKCPMTYNMMHLLLLSVFKVRQIHVFVLYSYSWAWGLTMAIFPFTSILVSSEKLC